MSCNVIQATLQAIYPGSSTLTITRSLNASLTPGGTSAQKSVGLTYGDGVGWAQLWYNGVEQFSCFASGCEQTIGQGNGGNSSTWVCSGLSCHCRPGTDFCGGSSSLDLSSPVNALNGPLTVACPGEGKCSFQQSFLQSLFGSSGLELSGCSHGECVQQYVVDQALGIVSAIPTTPSLSGGVIAGLAVVGAIVLAIIGLIIWAFLARKKARRDMRTDGAMPHSGGVGVVWSDVGYEVKSLASSSNKLAGAYWWMKGSSAGRSAEDGDKVGKGGGKVILRECGGQLPAGGFCAVLGPSGAGKSTLVDILAGKRKAGRVEGRVGYTKEDGGGRVKIGYVDQSDVLSPTSTVLETLFFAAKLRLPENIPISIKQERAQTVLAQLGLQDVAHTRVGSVEHRGISGGEMRRVSIGVELVAAPDVLVLDEPTSGLDSVSASRLIKLLKNLTETEKTTIIASIHQPSSALYHSFDQVCVLASGRQLYFGPGGNRPAEFFAQQNRPCPPGYNIADHLLDIATTSPEGLLHGSDAQVNGTLHSTPSGSSGPDKHSSDRSDKYLSDTPSGEKNLNFGTSAYPPTLGRDRAEMNLADLGDETTRQKRRWYNPPRTHCATTFLTQIEVLSGREWRNLKRDKTLLVAHIFFACILGVFAGGLYYQVNLTIAGFQNRVGSLFFLGSLIAFSSLSALYNLVEVRALFLRERAGSFYSPSSWLLTRVLFDVIPLRLIPTILVGVIVYFMVGLSKHAAEFFKFLLIIVEFSLCMCLFNFLLACVFRQGGVAILLSSLCNLFLMTYAGFFVNLGNIPPVLRWLRYFSTLGFTLEALSVNEVGAGLMIVDSLGGVPVDISATIIMQTLFGFDLGNYYRDVLVLFAYIAGFSLLLVATVVYILRERR